MSTKPIINQKNENGVKIQLSGSKETGIQINN